METNFINDLRKIIQRLGCCRVNISLTNASNIPIITDESNIEIRTQTNFSVNEDALIQNVPNSSKKTIPPMEGAFKIKNLDSGQEVDIRNQNKTDFVRQFSTIVNNEELSEDIMEYYEQKQKMNERLWTAAQKNEIEIVKLLLLVKNYGNLVAEVNSRDKNDETALHFAARNGNLKICQELIDSGQLVDINAKNVHKSTPLHLACKHGHYLVAQFLIRSGSIFNSYDDFGNSPLHYAVESGNTKLIKYLFHRFPDLTMKNQQGFTPKDLLLQKNIEIYAENKIESLNLTKSSEVLTTESVKISHNDFEAIQIIGRGSFGEVYLVKMISTGKLYAMKVLRKEKILEENLMKYVLVERNILSCINHPFIVKLNYAFQSEDKLYLVLDYCSGGNLTYYIAKEKHFSEDIAKVYMCEIILALEELHKNGIIYRDLKPDNLVLDGEGHILLTDFGLSKQGTKENFNTNSFCGSVAYLAPEMIKRNGHGKSVDWYLLGVLFYEMLIGFPPFYSSNREQLFRNIESAKVRVPARISKSAKSLLKKLMKRNPNKRIGSVNDAEEIKAHPFFANIDWESALRRELVPPLMPRNIIMPGYVPKYHMNEKPPDNEQLRYLENWTFIAN